MLGLAHMFWNKELRPAWCLLSHLKDTDTRPKSSITSGMRNRIRKSYPQPHAAQQQTTLQPSLATLSHSAAFLATNRSRLSQRTRQKSMPVQGVDIMQNLQIWTLRYLLLLRTTSTTTATTTIKTTLTTSMSFQSQPVAQLGVSANGSALHWCL